MDRLMADVAQLGRKPPFPECLAIEFVGTCDVVFSFSFKPPYNKVSVRLSPQYMEHYPIGESSMMVGTNFHVVPVAASLSIEGLACRIKDLCRSALAEEELGMTTAETAHSTSWVIESTIDVAATEGHFFGLNSQLLEDIRTAEPFLPVLDDHPTLGNATVILHLDLKRIASLTKTVASAWDVSLGEPLQIRLTVHRAEYTAAPITVEVGQSKHFRTGLFTGLVGQLKHILEHFFSLAAKNSDESPLIRLVQLGFDEDIAKMGLQRFKTVDEAATFLCTVTEEEMKSQSTVKLSKNRSPQLSIPAIKKLPSSEQGFLHQLAAYVLQRIPTVPMFCVICDRPHLFGGGDMVKSTVCSRPLCVFKFQQLNVGREVASSIAVQTGVVDVLVNFAKAAAASSRWEVIFYPFPHILAPTQEELLTPTSKNIGLAREAINAIPNTQNIVKSNSTFSLKQEMDKIHTLAYPMFQWIVNSNKSHLVKLPPDQRISFMGTEHQFLLITSSPDHESRFLDLKAKHPTVWAFHGSRSENWHSILRNGLKNATGSKFQVNGSAYGAGIYLSPHASVSFSYSGIGGTNSATNQSEFIEQQSMHCIAICEVIDHGLKKSGNIWVMPQEDHVMTRFFFVTGHNAQGSNADLTQKGLIDELNKATAAFY